MMQEKPYHQKFNKLSRFYLMALSGIALIIIFSEMLVQGFLNKQLNDSRVINVAGRQRMLSQQLAKTSLLIKADDSGEKRDSLKSELQNTLKLWSIAHYGLQNGNDSLELPGENSQKINNMFRGINPYFKEMESHATRIIKKINQPGKTPIEGLRPNIQGILRNETSFLKGMNAIVFQYDKEAKAKVNTLKKIEYGLLVLALTIMTLEIFFIFKPANSRFREILNDLIKSEQRAKHLARETRELNRALEKEMAEQKNRAAMIMQAQEEERTRISRDIHDGIGQLLTGLKLNLENLNCNNNIGLTELKTLTGKIIQEVRNVSYNLTPAVLEDYGLIPALKNLANEASRISPHKIHFQNNINREINLPTRITTNLYRIVQEAINNAIKYAGEQDIFLNTRLNAHQLEISVFDQGKGFDPENIPDYPDEHISGITNMKERANMINASLVIRSKPGNGTLIEIKLPIEPHYGKN